MIRSTNILKTALENVGRLFAPKSTPEQRARENSIIKFRSHIVVNYNRDYDSEILLRAYQIAYDHYATIPGAPNPGAWAENLFAAGKATVDAFSAWDLSSQGAFGLSQVLLNATIARCLAEGAKQPTSDTETIYLQEHILKVRWDILVQHLHQFDKEVVERYQEGLWDRWTVVSTLYDDDAEIEKHVIQWLYAAKELTETKQIAVTLPSDLQA